MPRDRRPAGGRWSAAPLDGRPRRSPASPPLLDRARDSGEPAAGAPRIELDGGPRAPLVAPVYAPASGPGAPTTSAERRARLIGWVVAPVDLGGARGRPHPRRGRWRRSTTMAPSTAPPAPSRGLARAGARGRGSDAASSGRVARATVGWSAPDGRARRSAARSLAPASAAAVLAVSRGSGRSETEARPPRATRCGSSGRWLRSCSSRSSWPTCCPRWPCSCPTTSGWRGWRCPPAPAARARPSCSASGSAPTRGAKAVLQPPDHLRGGRDAAPRAPARRAQRRPAPARGRAGARRVRAGVAPGAQRAGHRRDGERLAYASQQEALQRLRELDGLKTVFLGTASHELRTPATAIAGFASLLTASWDRFTEEQRRDFAERIAANARSLSAVVQDLLDFSLLDHGTLVGGAPARRPRRPGASRCVDRLGARRSSSHTGQLHHRSRRRRWPATTTGWSASSPTSSPTP